LPPARGETALKVVVVEPRSDHWQAPDTESEEETPEAEATGTWQKTPLWKAERQKTPSPRNKWRSRSKLNNPSGSSARTRRRNSSKSPLTSAFGAAEAEPQKN